MYIDLLPLGRAERRIMVCDLLLKTEYEPSDAAEYPNSESKIRNRDLISPRLVLTIPSFVRQRSKEKKIPAF